MPGAGEGADGALAPQCLPCPGSWADMQKGSRARGPQLVLPALAHELWLRLQGWLGSQAISLTSVTRSQERFATELTEGAFTCPGLLTLHLCGFFLKEGH